MGDVVYLTRDQILQANDTIFKEVVVPEWGGTVRVKGLTGVERDKFESGLIERQGKKTIFKLDNIKARLVALSVVDETGKRLFREEDVLALGRKSAKALNRIADVCRELSGITDEDLEDYEKNCDKTTGDDLPTD